MRAKLKESGLSAEHARRCGFVLLTKDELIKRYPQLSSLPAGGFLLPYFDIAGKKTDFYRFRRLEDPERRGFDAAVAHKTIRYSQPGGVPPRPYFSPLYDWKKYLAAPVSSESPRSVMITEGENKANCAAANGIPCIGLGGVWCFKTAKTALLPELEKFPWEGTSALIVFDSDAASNPDIVRAENELARQLIQRKALVFIVRLPQLEKGKKTGLDDFLVAEGKDALNKLLERVEEYGMSVALRQLNEELIVVHNPPCVLRVDNMLRMSVYNFKTLHYADVKYTVIRPTKNGTDKTEERSAAKDWLEWPGRNKVDGFTYLPGGDPLILGRYKLYNVWPGWGISERYVKPGSVRLWDRLMNFIFSATAPEARTWFERWLAYPLQHPGVKMNTCVAIWGPQGTGKNLIGYTMRRIYGRNFAEISEAALLSAHNEWAENTQFVVADEIASGEHKRLYADRLKSLITQQEVRINPKFIGAYTLPDRMNYYFTSNHPDAFFMEDEDRRFFVHEIKNSPLPDEFYAEYDEWYKSEEGAGALFYYFLHLDLGDFSPQARAPETQAKRSMISLGRSEFSDWLATKREFPETLQLRGDPLNGNGRHYSSITASELLAIYTAEAGGPTKLSTNGIARELARQRFVRLNNGTPIQVRYEYIPGQIRTETVKLWLWDSPEKYKKAKTPHDIARVYCEERKLKIVEGE